MVDWCLVFFQVVLVLLLGGLGGLVSRFLGGIGGLVSCLLLGGVDI